VKSAAHFFRVEFFQVRHPGNVLHLEVEQDRPVVNDSVVLDVFGQGDRYGAAAAREEDRVAVDLLGRMAGQIDNELMQRIQRNETGELGVLYERYKKNLFGFFYKITYDRDVSEDLVQDVFMKILKYRDSFRGHGKFTTWMYSIAHNTGVDHFRKQSRYFNSEDPEIFNSVNTGGEENSALKEEEIDLLSRAMLRMDPEKREILTLSKIDGLRYKEMGDILNCSANTVKGKVFRALKDLKGIISKMEVPENGKEKTG